MERHRKAEKDKLLHTSLEEEGRGGRRRRSEEVGGRETRREAGGDGERNRSSERSRDGPSTLTQRVAHVAVDRNPGRSTVRSTRDGVSMCLLLLLLLACACCCCWSGVVRGVTVRRRMMLQWCGIAVLVRTSADIPTGWTASADAVASPRLPSSPRLSSFAPLLVSPLRLDVKRSAI